MLKVKFHGRLRKYEKEFMEVHVDTTKKVFQYLVSRFGTKFKTEILDNAWHITQGKRKSNKLSKKDRFLNEKEIDFKIPEDELHIFPAIAGSGRFGQIILGVVLIIVGAVLLLVPGGQLGGVEVENIGVGLLVAGIVSTASGIVTLLTRPPSVNRLEQGSGPTEQKPSFIFNGTTNTTEQGVPVPLVYGEHLTGSVVINGGVNTIQI